jgi:hypothetical protein
LDNFINILCQLFGQYPFAKKLQSQNVTREKLHKALSYEKRRRKMLIKSTPSCLSSSKMSRWCRVQLTNNLSLFIVLAHQLQKEATSKESIATSNAFTYMFELTNFD